MKTPPVKSTVFHVCIWVHTAHIKKYMDAICCRCVVSFFPSSRKTQRNIQLDRKKEILTPPLCRLRRAIQGERKSIMEIDKNIIYFENTMELWYKALFISFHPRHHQPPHGSSLSPRRSRSSVTSRAILQLTLLIFSFSTKPERAFLYNSV